MGLCVWCNRVPCVWITSTGSVGSQQQVAKILAVAAARGGGLVPTAGGATWSESVRRTCTQTHDARRSKGHYISAGTAREPHGRAHATRECLHSADPNLEGDAIRTPRDATWTPLAVPKQL